MKLEEVSNNKQKRDHRKPAKQISAPTATYPMDEELKGLVAAIRASTILCAYVVTLKGNNPKDRSLEAVAKFIRGLRSEAPLTAYVVITPEVVTTDTDHRGTDNVVCRIFPKSVGTTGIAPIETIQVFPSVGEIEILSNFDEVQELIDSLDGYCAGAACIAVADQNGIIPLWAPL